ncbi:MAG: ribosome maturation factor RimM, partial [Chloroflexota bacterium]
LGEVRVKPLGRTPERFRELKRVYVGEDHVPTDVLHRRTAGAGAALRLSTVTNREAARALFQTFLYVPESEAIKLPKGEYFVHQIVGLTIITVDGETLGTIRDVLQTGSNDVYLVKQGKRELLIPAIKDVIKRIDLDAGTIEVALLPGLLD